MHRFFTISATWGALDVPGDSQTQHAENRSQHPCLQTNFPFSVNNATSTWSPKRETGRHSEHPSSDPHGTPSPDDSTPLTSPVSACPLHPHSTGPWQTPSWCPCLWTHFLLSPPLDQESAFFIYLFFFFVDKGPVVDTFGFVGPKVFSTTTQYCHCYVKVIQIIHKRMSVTVFQISITYLQRQVEGQICPTSHSLLTLVLHWDQNDLSKSQVQLYLLSCLKAFPVSLSKLFPKPSRQGLLPALTLESALCPLQNL